MARTPRVVASNRAKRLQVALERQAVGGGFEAPVALLEDAALLGDERIEVVGRDQLVLGAVDELDDRAEGPARIVVDEVEARRDVPEEQDLRDAVEDVGPRGQAGIGGVLGQDPLAEAVEVRDGHPRADPDAHRVIEACLELLGRLDVVGQDEQVLGQDVVAVLQEKANPLDDHARLAGARPGDDHQRPIAQFDDAALLVREAHGQCGANGGDHEVSPR